MSSLGEDSSPSGCLGDQQVVAFAEGRLSSSARAEVEEHLDGCDTCQRLVAVVALGSRTDSGLQLAPPSARRIVERIDEFELVCLLGRGAMGEVWLARDTLLDREVAIKLGLGTMTDEARLRFLIESRAVARLRHPNILAVHHAGELHGQPFLVTERLHGKSLDALGKLPPARVVVIGLDLARALAAAHAAGVHHRDIKPANAFLCEDGTAKLLDFGLAQLLQEPSASSLSAPARAGTGSPGVASALDMTQPEVSLSGRVVGTPHYMAPETWRGEGATRATDVYSFGALLFTLLVGSPPYAAEVLTAHASDVLHVLRAAALGGRLPDLATLAPDAPALLVELVRGCLSLDAEARPSAEAVCLALQSLITPEVEPVSREGDENPTENPYQGLRSFEAAQRRLFFGRDNESAAVLTELAGAPFVLVVGPSGAGKSSLVRAGVVPRLLRGALGHARWNVAAMVPGDSPIERLAQALAPVLEQTEDEVLQHLKSSPAWGSAHFEERGGDARLLLFVDQFEEAWTLSRPEGRAAFFEALAAFASIGPRVRIVATLRVDFLGQLEDLGELGALALRAPVVLGPLSTEGLRRAITLPARLHGVEIDPGLCDALIDKAEGAVGMLPLLEFALGVLWERRGDGIRISSEDLAALGGLEGALATHADAVLGRMSPLLRDEARRILLSLVTVERTRTRQEERALAGDSGPARTALAALVEARLVVASAGDETTAYELAHEALVNGWPALRSWLDEESAVREVLERLRRSVAEWERLGRAVEGLWSARQLEELSVVDARPIPPEATIFVATSRAAIRRARALRIGLLLAVPLSIALTTAVVRGVSYVQRRAAVGAGMAIARQLAAKADERARAVDEARAAAFAAFEKDDLGPAEMLWKQALAREEEADTQRRELLASVEKALALDPRDPSARALAADVKLARLLAAERLHQRTRIGALAAELAAYDDGSRRAWLEAAGHVTAQSDPPGAAMTLSRYREDDAGHLVETEAAPLAPNERRALPTGSYLITAEAAGRYPTRYPFLVQRGEESSLRVVLPPAADVPDGMIYVPAGRTLYGSGDDEGMRGIFTHEPRHPVVVEAFLIARTEVTNAEYLAFLSALPEAERKTKLPYGLFVMPDGRLGFRLREKVLAPGELYCSGVEPCVDWSRVPVMGANREHGVRFARWRAGEGGLPGARLCTDREWERAARGADDRMYPASNTAPGPKDACTLATYGGDAGRAGPCAAGTHPASRSPFGVDDLTGSQAEWTAGPADIAQPARGIIRGAGWVEGTLDLAISNRGLLGIQFRSRQYGVRICADVR